jgi:hypothetical protein
MVSSLNFLCLIDYDRTHSLMGELLDILYSPVAELDLSASKKVVSDV